MVEEQRSLDGPTLESLKDAAGAFEALDNGTYCNDLNQAVKAALSRLCGAISACEEAGIDKCEILARLANARTILRRSSFIARTQEWPRGYAGDFETIEYMCDALNRAPVGSMEYVLEDLALNIPIAFQHRNKVAFQADAMVSACKHKDGHPRILSIGCGGCRDIRSAADQLLETKAEFVLCDHDEGALDFARHVLGPLAERCTYLKGMIPRALRNFPPFGPFDLAVVGGVFDYLSDFSVTVSIRDIWHRLLAPGGELVFTNIKRGNPFRVWLEYLGNWELNERDESEVVKFCTEVSISKSAVQVQVDETGLALLVKCQRPKR
jgi:SAM-dependent methyltransferase